jgi:Mib_herc2
MELICNVYNYRDWEWGQQDGGEGKNGRVMEIRGWDNESCRSVANVSWASGSTNVYRLGEFLKSFSSARIILFFVMSLI